ncbi:MAG TPA: hypothetical protein VKC52_08880 [Acidimicrobiia bacterium]|nr:hypothetical protein [Acidimicrobiia bacterium]
MTDDLPPDERDEELASLLEVPPLDDVTRERLVTRALDDASPRRPARRLARLLVPAAAALVALVLVGVGVFALVNRDGDNAGTAGRSRTPEAASPSQRSPAPDASSSAEAATGVRDLGDLGDVTDSGELRRRVRAQLDEAPVSSSRAAPPRCLERAVAGSPAPTAYATGTHRDQSVLVLVLPASGDRSTLVLLDTRTCRAVSVFDLA